MFWGLPWAASSTWWPTACRHCGARIAPRLLAVEIVTGLLFLAIFLKFGVGLTFVLVAAATSLLLVVAVIDLERGLILNRIVLPSVVVLLVLAPFWSQLGFAREFPISSGMIASLANSLAAGAAGFLVFLLIALAHPQGMGGGGDVKYAGLLGLLLGIPGVLVALWGAVVSGGLVAIYLLAMRKRGRKEAIPFGPFMSLGGIAVLLAGDEIFSEYQRLIDSVSGS